MAANNFRFSKRSEGNLAGVTPALVKVVRRALELTAVDFVVTEGVRSMARQQELVREGKSQTLNSRHLTGHAVDVFALPTSAGSWDMKYYRQIADAFLAAGKELDIELEWGGDWKTLRDGPHFQLTFRSYPA